MSVILSRAADAEATIVKALAVSANGDALTEEQEDDAMAAAWMLILAQFVRTGMSDEDALRWFDRNADRDHDFRFAFSEAEGLTVSIEFADGRGGTAVTFTEGDDEDGGEAS